ncbi:MAG TPA: hypothetical protein PKY59_04750 [Pyrinomonadaceae bacterium]|nr:hypothetical protein [Pyrinomonadaceae bacterium]
MSKLFQNLYFILGIVLGFLIFVGLNFYSLTANYGNCIDCFGETGFPFTWMDRGWFLQNILWFGLVADAFFAVIFCFLIGLILKEIREKISARKLN